jgi:hypothetical protein
MTIDYRRIFLTLLAILLVMAACVLAIRLQALQDLVRDGLILPVVYAAWLAGLLVRSLDQPLLWAGGLFILGALLVYGLFLTWPERVTRAKPLKYEEGQIPAAHGQVRFWRNKIESLRSQGLDSEYASFEFRRIAQAVEEISDKNGASGAAEHPPEVEVFFKKTAVRSAKATEAPLNWRETLRNRFAALTQRPPAPERDPLAELCTFLEDELEIENDDRD